MISKILDKTIKRSRELCGWECPDIIEFEYWDVRYVLSDKMKNDPMSIATYILQKYGNIKKEISQSENISFFFWIKDELVEIAEMEKLNLTSRKVKTKQQSKYKPSPRINDFPQLIELFRLSDGNPLVAEKIKKLKYSVIFETLLAKVIENEGSYE